MRTVRNGFGSHEERLTGGATITDIKTDWHPPLLLLRHWHTCISHCCKIDSGRKWVDKYHSPWHSGEPLKVFDTRAIHEDVTSSWILQNVDTYNCSSCSAQSVPTSPQIFVGQQQPSFSAAHGSRLSTTTTTTSIIHTAPPLSPCEQVNNDFSLSYRPCRLLLVGAHLHCVPPAIQQISLYSIPKHGVAWHHFLLCSGVVRSVSSHKRVLHDPCQLNVVIVKCLPRGMALTIAKASRIKVTNVPKEHLHEPASFKVLWF